MGKKSNAAMTLLSWNRMVAKADAGALIIGDLLDDMPEPSEEVERAIDETMGQIENLIILISEKAQPEDGGE